MRAPVLSLDVIKSAYNGDLEAIKDLSETLWWNLTHRQERRLAARPKARRKREGDPAQIPLKSGDLGDRQIKTFAYLMLRACEREMHAPPPELVNLFQIVLGQDKPPAGSDRKYVQRLEAIRYLATNSQATDSEIARVVGVHRGSVGRWRKKDLLQS